jgi:hypothetical protein
MAYPAQNEGRILRQQKQHLLDSYQRHPMGYGLANSYSGGGVQDKKGRVAGTFGGGQVQISPSFLRRLEERRGAISLVSVQRVFFFIFITTCNM